MSAPNFTDLRVLQMLHLAKYNSAKVKESCEIRLQDGDKIPYYLITIEISDDMVVLRFLESSTTKYHVKSDYLGYIRYRIMPDNSELRYMDAGFFNSERTKPRNKATLLEALIEYPAFKYWLLRNQL